MPTNLLKDKDFIDLKTSLTHFDPFRVLRVIRSENRHSNVLAWLLDPSGNHQIGDDFTNNFLRSVLVYNDCLKEYPEIDLYTYNQDEEGGIENTVNFSDVKIIREWSENGLKTERRVDILGISEKHKLVFFIENKIDSTKSEKQLEDCFNIVENYFNGFKVLPIFLTLDYEDLSESEKMYKTFSYDNLQYIIRRSQKKAIPTAKAFISNYLDIIEELTILDEMTFNQCQNLNNKHISIINDHKKTRNLGLADKNTIRFLKVNKDIGNRVFKRAFKKFAEYYRYTIDGSHKHLESNIAKKYQGTYRDFWFTNSGWLKPYLWYDGIPPAANTLVCNNWPLPYPLCFKFIKLNNNKLVLQLLIGPEDLFQTYFPDKTREDFIQTLEENAESKYAEEQKLDYNLKKKTTHKIWEIAEDFSDWGNVKALSGKMSDMYLDCGGKNKPGDQTLLYDLFCTLEVLKKGTDLL